MGAPERIDAVLLRRSHVMRNVGVAIALFGWGIAVGSQGDARLLWLVGLGTVGAVLAILGNEGTLRRVAATIDARGIRAGDDVVAVSPSIRSGWIERSSEGSTVYLERGFWPAVRLEARDDVEAHAVLRVLARDASHALVTFPSASRVAALAGSVGGQLLAYGLAGRASSRHDHLGFFVAQGCLVVLLMLLLRDEMAIGADGVLLTSFFRTRFVPFVDIESACVDDVGKIVMHTRTHGVLTRRMRSAAAEAAVEQIQSSMASIRPRYEPVRQQLRREEPNVYAWLTRLRALAGRGSYRAIGLVGDSLWQVMDDPGATGAERAAAAVVVGTVATPEERVRLREAAARIASPRVRVAIERAADPTDEADLAVALAALDDSPGEHSR